MLRPNKIENTAELERLLKISNSINQEHLELSKKLYKVEVDRLQQQKEHLEYLKTFKIQQDKCCLIL